MGRTGAKCGDCDQTFKNGAGWVGCCACKEYYHRACSGLNDIEFDGIVECSKKNSTAIRYTCRLCDTDVKNILDNVQKFKKMQKELEKIQAETNNKIEAIEKRVINCEKAAEKNASLETRVKKLEEILPCLSEGATGQTNEIPPSFRDIMKKDIQKSVSKKIEEKLDKFQDIEERQLIEEKKNNVIMFNVPELASVIPEDRLRHDRSKFIEIFKIREENFDDETIESMYRVGKRDSEKVRPILIKFCDEETKMKYLKESRDLKIKVGDEEERIYVSNDLTRNQREKTKQLATEIKKRRDQGEENLVIRNFQIVKKDFPTSDGRDGPMKRPSWKRLFSKK